MNEAATKQTAQDSATLPDAAAAKPDVTEIADKLKSKEPGEVRKAIDQEPDLYKKILEMDDKDLEQLELQLTESASPDAGKAQETPSSAKPGETSPQGEKPTEKTTEPESDITITLKPSELGTYLKNRTPQEAIKQLIEGKRKADETITFYKDQSIPVLERTAKTMLSQNQQLRQEVIELRKKLETPSAAAEQKPTDKAASPQAAALPELPQIPNEDEVDFLDPESQKNLMKTVRDLHERATALQTENAHLRAAPPAKEKEPTKETPESKTKIPEGLAEAVEREYDEVRLLQHNPDHEGLFTSKSDIKDVERQYVEFVQKLAELNHLPAIFDAQGSFTPEASRMVMVYFDTKSPDGVTLRTAADAIGVKPPEDMPALSRIYTVRSIRNRYAQIDPGTGVAVTISYEEAAKMAKAMQPEVFTSPEQKLPAGSDSEAISRGVEKRKAFAAEIPRASGADVNDLHTMDVNEFYRLMLKPREEYTAEESETVRRILKEQAQMSDTEIENFFKQPGG